MRTRQHGFTLVELAIVLVIIGLLLGGILKGQEMVAQARVKNVIADFSGVSAAYYGYQDRYRALPGDDPNAGTRWGARPGNNNGIVEGAYNNGGDPCTSTVESCSWWDHLRRAGFIAGNGVAQPNNAVAGVIGVQTGDGSAPPAAALGALVTLITCSANLPDKIAIAVDSQLDDGDARTGTVRGQLHTGGGNPDISEAPDAANYVENGTNLYTVCRTM
jgi:prepilin-type N-terminal cleavage/methylation domain-containing protein